MTKVHLVGNAHLDPVWLWRWQEGFSEVLATFRSALDRMIEFDDYVFTCAGAAYYKWVEETDPAMFAEIQQRVKEGRWVIVGGWWIQPDCNAPSAESFARHALYSQRYYREKFGVQAEIGYNVDSFGHNAMIPQFLKNAGMRGYVFMRPDPFEEKQYPFGNTSFMWESPDGTRMPTFRISDGYGTGTPEKTLKDIQSALDRADTYAIPDMCFYGIGNHGGGPTIEMLNALEAMLKDADPADVAYSSPNTFFDQLDESKLPVYSYDLQHHASGCYTTVMEIKELNRRAEQQLAAAEKYVALAEWHGFHVDAAPLAEAWQMVLFNQFHDVMGGCSIRTAMEDAVIDLKHAIHVAQQVTNMALQKLAWNMDTSRGHTPVRSKTSFKLWSRGGLGAPMTLFNPHSWPVKTVIRNGSEIGSGDNQPAIETGDGQSIPFQKARGPMLNGTDDRWESVFVAEIPALGWKTFWQKSEGGAPVEKAQGMLVASGTHLENDWLMVDFSAETGALIRLYDKKKGCELISAPADTLVIDETKADTWAHGIFEFRDVIGKFGNAKVELAEAGEVFATVRVTSFYESSKIICHATLYRELPGLHMSYTVEWNETHRMLKLAFPTPFTGGEVGSIPGGALKRTANGKEQPMQNWVSMGELGIVTDTRAAYDCLDGEVRITALRSPLYADHYGQTIRDAFCEPMAQGENRFTVILTGETDPAQLSRMAAELVCPPDRILGTYHVGALSEVDCGMTVEGDSVIVDAIKRAEDGNGWIVRLREASGQPVSAKVELKKPGLLIETDLTPWQIKTLRLTDSAVIETDYTEGR